MQFVQKAQFILENLHFSSIFTRTWLPWRYVRVRVYAIANPSVCRL